MLAASCSVALVLLSPLTLQDYPAHLARAVAMADLLFHGGAHYGGMFSYHFLFVPYILGDLGFTAFVELFGPRFGGGLWIVVVFLSLPCALLFVLRVLGVVAERQVLIFILSLYIATDWFFLMGFLSFRLAVALTICDFALVILLRRRWSAPLFALYSMLVVLSYLTHLSTILFLAAAVGVSGLLQLWRRASTLRNEALFLAPLAAMYAWHFGVAVGYDVPGDPIENPYTWGTLYGKFARLDFEFIRFDRHTDLLMLAVVAVCVLLGTSRVRLRDLARPSVFDMLILAATFIALYVALPMGYADAWYVDVRPLPFVTVFLILTWASLPVHSRALHPHRAALAIALAAALVIGNLLYLQRHLIDDGAWLKQYRAIIAAAPVGARVFPVYTHAPEGVIKPFLHANSFITIDRDGLMPYAFTGDTANPMKYVRYVHKPYRPQEAWYLDPWRGGVDWQRVLGDYDYLLVTKPFDAGRIPLRTTTVAENGTAVLLAIPKKSHAVELRQTALPRVREGR